MMKSLAYGCLILVGVAAGWFIGMREGVVESLRCTTAPRYGWALYPAAALAFLATLAVIRRGRSRHSWIRHGSLVSVTAALIVPWCVGMFYGPTLGNAIHRGEQKATMRDMRFIAQKIEDYRSVFGSYPTAVTIEHLEKQLADVRLWRVDAWGHGFMINSRRDSYVIASYGHCSEPDVQSPDDYEPEQTVSYSSDIVLRDGVFVRCPLGFQK